MPLSGKNRKKLHYIQLQYTVNISSELCKSLCTKLNSRSSVSSNSEIVHYRQEGRRQGTIGLPLPA